MDAGISQKNPSQAPNFKLRMDYRKTTLKILSAFFAILFIALPVIIHINLNSKVVYKGVLIDGNDVGGYTREQLKSYLENQMSDILKEIDITISSPGFERHVSASELGLKIDIAKMAENAYNVGRTGNILDRLIKIVKLSGNPVSIDPVFDFETREFKLFLDNVCRDVFKEVVPYNIMILEDRVVLTTGLPGQRADRERLESDIINAVRSLKPAYVEIQVVETPPPKMDIETIVETVNQEPVDARFVKTSRTTYEITPHMPGRKIDRDKLIEIVNELESKPGGEYEEIILPVEFVTPDVTEEYLRDTVFKDTLSSYTTHFRTDGENNYNRSINIGLAAESIDGTILLPGEEFSFNKVVGPRTAAKGYRTAHVFVEGQIRDGTGGGVCQVSTTLYNAVLRANLQVSERHNHMFTVGYVPLGQDAAVSYGYADLVFTNTRTHPIKISARVTNGNSLTFWITSVNEYPNLRVKLAHKTISTTPRTVEYINDSSLPRGTVIVSENGMDGYVVDTYMSVFNGDTLIREEKLYRSVYHMLPRKIIRGTAPAYEEIEEYDEYEEIIE